MPQPEQQHGNRQLNGYVCVFITFSAAATALTLRLIARRLMKLQLWYDDWLAVIAAICAAVWTGLVLWWLRIGLGLPLSAIGHDDDTILQKSRLILWALELFYGFSLAFAKMAILAFYWRMFKTSVIKLPIQVLAVCAVVWLIIRTFLAIFHCVPVQKFWLPQLDGVCTIDDSNYFFGNVLTHLAIDLAILALPVIEVQKLHLPIAQKLGIIGMFMFGIFVCVASVVVLVYSKQYDAMAGDMQWNIAPIIIWATVEVNLAIVSACLPMLRPIYLLMRRRPLNKVSSSGSRYQANSHPVHSTTHKMVSLTVRPSFDKDSSESTHQLAGAREGSISSSEGYGDDVAHGNHTVITGSAEEGRKSEAVDRERQNERDRVMGGITVTSETSVRVDRAF
ncbi:hypothetical protein K491DRAFT_610129 [Lophiostoma macrostomum CBS 122681]|uniref:Rhodopsin domain-containing protein n=1 Tax=Lophiostoma macrostomum CBS 122681 TaxID=1314788 RepID=A0A6A6SRY2_9PLEO|nr:hypothetical protein K491DRAFT_610129 [Lophiostoma macrostomum CBS 122681]